MFNFSFCLRTPPPHLQPLDWGIIAWLKFFHKKQLMMEICRAMSDCNTVVELAKKVTIYDAIVSVKDGWDQHTSSTITNCFKSCGIFDGMFDVTPIAYEDQTTPQSQEPDQFDCWFEELLEVPWDEYLAFDDPRESEAPIHAPTAMATPNTNVEQDEEDTCIPCNQPCMIIDSAIEYLNQMQKLFVDNDVIFAQINNLY